jgi:hypothetical protein
MSDFFSIRLSVPDDAQGIVHAHHSAVHETAAQDYSEEILNGWSRPVDAQRIATHRAKMESDKSIISFVAVDDSGTILGFGELVPPETSTTVPECFCRARARSSGAIDKVMRPYTITPDSIKEPF